ncbi:acyl-CoA dehydrogenase family protein [Vibrio caribbeanicus]|uniref:Acyl-CoA dehydrogenase domain protein n=1 Tax=Vibrio caribbeanicus ATCC BAA-2122 TaxID=796620 RepID=E3BLC5_9VIBR|nr:acyl-CoA dehydrogenase family protein [Vibrio caribbeanicus]EFP96137.1 acyl-CoA dehydrogenase domain protein [Vibrio caribbeanicus ATCC BAA-2122]
MEFKSKVKHIISNYSKRNVIHNPDSEPDIRGLCQLLGMEQLLAPSWSKEYGGIDLGQSANLFVLEEIVSQGLSETLYLLSVHFVGGILNIAGTESQKNKFLPEIAKGQTFFSILYTERTSGSDLSSLETQAVRLDDGTFVINGEKIYSLKSQQADYALCAVRTDSSSIGHNGITLFIVPLNDENVILEHLDSISDENFCRVRFNNLQVTSEDIVGEIDQGWPLITEAISLERTGFDYYIKAERFFKILHESTPFFHRGTWDDHYVNALEFELGCAKNHVNEVLSDFFANGKVNEYQGAIAKLISSELAVKIINYTHDNIDQSSVIIHQPQVYNKISSAYRESQGLLLSAGSSEMMLETIARKSIYEEGVI